MWTQSLSILPLVLSLAGAVVCAPYGASYQPKGATCQKWKIPLSVTSLNYQFNATKFTNNLDVVNFTTAISTVNSTSVFQPVDLPINQTFDIEISATFCEPKKRRGKTVILATHGIGTDGSYWASPFEPETYNFVEHAIEKGISVFYYDRVGTGHSTKLSGYVVQLPMQVEILRQLATKVGAGSYTGSFGKPDKLILQGFSFGSFVTHTTISNYPTIADGVVFTGLGYSATAFTGFLEGYNPRLAMTQRPYQWGQLDSGYLTWVDLIANVNTYFKEGGYELDAVKFTDETKNPFPVMEILSLQEGLGVNPMSQKFTGPILDIVGEFDYFACAGYCNGFIEGNVSPFFTGSKSVEIAIHPQCGHNLNFNKNATGVYNIITDFVAKNF